MNAGKIFLFPGNKILPFISLPLLTWFWMREGGVAFMILVVGLPLLFGYIVPGIGTNYLKMWRFHDSWTVGHYFIHHGFIYASTFGCALCVAFFKPASDDWLTLLGNMARGAGILGFVLWLHDLIGIREGLMEVFSEHWERGEPPEVITFHYAPLCFSLLGASYTGIVTIGYQFIVLDRNTQSLWWLLPLGVILMAAVTMLPFLSWTKRIFREIIKKSS